MGDYSNLNDGQRSNNGKSKFFEIFKLKSGNKRRLAGASERPSKCERVHREVRFFTLTFYFASLISVMIFSFFDICHSILLACGTVRRLRTCWTGTPWWKSITQLWKVTLERIRRRVEAYIWGLLTRSLSWLCMKIASLDETPYMISFVPFRWSHNGLVIDETRFF